MSENRYGAVEEICEGYNINTGIIVRILELYAAKKITDEEVLRVLQWVPETVRVKLIKEYM